jgi:hypothetical protein
MLLVPNPEPWGRRDQLCTRSPVEPSAWPRLLLSCSFSGAEQDRSTSLRRERKLSSPSHKTRIVCYRKDPPAVEGGTLEQGEGCIRTVEVGEVGDFHTCHLLLAHIEQRSSDESA